MTGKIWLVLASLFFYGYWVSDYILLIIGSILVNYFLGTALNNHEIKERRISKKLILVTGVVFNVGLLGYFKYIDFIIININFLINSEISSLNILLPLAISFFTFQQIAYLVDSYQAGTKEYSFLNYCLFVTFFPQLIAGPIVHHGDMMPQFARTENQYLQWKNILVGCLIFGVGLFKKVVIADTFAGWANEGYAIQTEMSFLQAWSASLSYTFQLYYDFSGYTDMAIGAALLFNIRLPINFNSPYKSLDIQDFWRRWHITLSSWLRDYIYIPLGGNRKGTLSTYSNLLTTFIIGGLWHGAAWTFVIWGSLHGGALVINKIWQRTGYKLPTILAWLVTFLFVHIAWVFFRAETLDEASRVLKGMINFNSISLSQGFADQVSAITQWYGLQELQLSSSLLVPEWSVLACLAILATTLYCRNSIAILESLLSMDSIKQSTIIKYSFAMAMGSILLFTSSAEVFLYFNF
jgi:D-alanyl-lipoteichoic acid acyltransferase DltB (MBOAT superfamily)